MPTLYFIRHGETDWNRDRRLQGHIDIPLNERGRRQAKAAALHLTDLFPQGASGLPVHLSPLARTRETAEILRANLPAAPLAWHEDPRLKEIGFGAWEGRTWAEIRSRDPGRARDRDRDCWNFVPPAGESYAMVAERVGAWLETVREDAIVVAHGGVGRVMMVLFGAMPREQAVNEDIWQGKVLVLRAGAAHWQPHSGHH